MLQPSHPFFPSAFAQAVVYWGNGGSREAAAQSARIRPDDLRRYVGSDGLTALGRDYANRLPPAYRQEVMDAVEQRRRGGGMRRSIGRMLGFGGSSSRAAPPARIDIDLNRPAEPYTQDDLWDSLPSARGGRHPDMPPESPAVSSQPAGGVDNAALAWALSNIEPDSFRHAILSRLHARSATDAESDAQFAQIPSDYLRLLLQSEERPDGTSQLQLTPLGQAYVDAEFSFAERVSLGIIAPR